MLRLFFCFIFPFNSHFIIVSFVYIAYVCFLSSIFLFVWCFVPFQVDISFEKYTFYFNSYSLTKYLFTIYLNHFDAKHAILSVGFIFDHHNIHYYYFCLNICFAMFIFTVCSSRTKKSFSYYLIAYLYLFMYMTFITYYNNMNEI